MLSVLAATLYVVATPIGNLEDITLRALRTLRDEVSLIACEDTRQTSKLLEHFQIRKRLWSYHEHNESSRTREILQVLERGESVALVSDAGTPLVSDPGYRLVRSAIEANFPVVPLPGASALLAGLAGSGLPTDEFRFVGFLPAKSGARRKMLEQLRNERMTVIAYESPHRVLESLSDMAEIFGDLRPISLARELTKVHEEFLRGSAADIHNVLAQRPAIKGEITLIIGGAVGMPTGDPLEELAKLENAGMERMEAIKLVAKQLNLPKREVYRLATERGSNSPDKRHD